MKSLSLVSPAKLNLFLNVLNKRKDGFHNIKTVFERIDLCDKIVLSPAKNNVINITSNMPGLPSGRGNLAYRAAELLKTRFSISKGINIYIEKHIPIGAGLGGGSSNAATVLVGINKFFKLGLKDRQIINYSKVIGSDVPFFAHNTSFAFAQGRGEIITPLKNVKKCLWHVLVVPELGISTKEAYLRLDQFRKLKTNMLIHSATPNNVKSSSASTLTTSNLRRAYTNVLTRLKIDVKLINYLLQNKGFNSCQNIIFNAFEQVICKDYKEINTIKSALEGFGLESVSMTGKGPAVFGLVSSRKEAFSIYNRLKKHKNWRIFAVRTL